MRYEFRGEVLAENNADIKLHYRYAADRILGIDNLDVRVVNRLPLPCVISVGESLLDEACSPFAVKHRVIRRVEICLDRSDNCLIEYAAFPLRDRGRLVALESGERIFSRTCGKFLLALLYLSHKICVFFINIKYMYYL